MYFPDATEIPTVKVKAVSIRNRVDTPEHSEYDGANLPSARNSTDVARLQTLKPLGAYLAVFSVIYAVVLAVPYAFVDDYPALAETIQGNLASETHERLYGGRPVLALFFQWVFSFVHSLGGMRLARLIGIISVAVLAWLLYLALSHAKVPRSVALLIPILIGTLPAFQVYVSWSIASVAITSCIFGGLALFAVEMACQRIMSWRNTDGHQRLALLAAGYCVAAGALLLAGLAIDQATGLFYWVFAAIFMLAADRRTRELLVRGVVYLAVAGIAMGLEYLVVTALARLSGAYFARDALVTTADLPTKIQWFFNTALYCAVNLWILVPRVSVAVCMSMLIVVGLLLYVRGPIWERLLKLGIALALLPLGYLANLAVAEDWASYRSQVVISSLLALYFGLAVVGIVRAVIRNVPRAQAVTSAALATVCVVACFGAASAVAIEFAIPSYVEFNMAVEQLRSQPLTGKKEVYFIQPTWNEGVAPFVRFDEFGYTSSTAPWVPAPMTYLALAQVNPAYENLPVVIAHVNPDGSTPPPPRDSVVINMHHLSDSDRLTMCLYGWGYCPSS